MATRANDRRRGSRGMGTAEMLVGAFMSLMILAVASSFFTGQQRMLLVQSAYAQSQNVTRTFTDLFGRELRMASYDPSGGAISISGPPTCAGVSQGITEATVSSMRFKQDLNGDGDTADDNEDVRYYVSGSQIMRQNQNDAAIVLVDGVPSGGLVFTYYNNQNPPGLIPMSGNPATVSAANRDCIAKVKVRVTAQLASPQFYDIQPLISTVETEAAIRNRSLINF